MPFQFEDLKAKTCVITGGGGVIGKAIASALAAVKCNVVIVDLFKEAADKVASELSKKHEIKSVGITANVLDKMSLLKAKDEINASFGKIDLAIV